jgi:hypothetical protein
VRGDNAWHAYYAGDHGATDQQETHMIPLTDASRRPVRFPIATVTIIVINFIVFFFELAYGDDFINRWSMVPADIVAGHNLITILTAMFMHAGWEHTRAWATCCSSGSSRPPSKT